MKSIPNHIVTELLRYLPMLIANQDKSATSKSLRLTNAIRKIKVEIIPRLEKVNNQTNEKR